MTSIQKVSVQECDYLDQDPPLRGQNYVCLSFISPEEVIKKKEVFIFEEFLKSFSKDLSDFFQHLEDKYKDDVNSIRNIKERYQYIFDTKHIQDEFAYFVNNNSTLEEEYFKQNDFQTSIRGIKVRGVFDSLREAEIRAQVLKKIDDKFNVYVAEVGCWCPWSPNPDDISNQEYAETHLNTIMAEYKKNQEKKDLFFQERKRELQFSNVKAEIEKDTWMEQKQDSSEAGPSSVEVVGTSEKAQDPVVSVEKEEAAPVETEVSETST